VQIYEALAELCSFALLLTLLAKRDQWTIRNGEIMGAWLFLHGVSSFLLSFLRGDIAANNFLLPQTLTAAMVLVGGMLWLC